MQPQCPICGKVSPQRTWVTAAREDKTVRMPHRACLNKAMHQAQAQLNLLPKQSQATNYDPDKDFCRF
jgi:hypothetical protein